MRMTTTEIMRLLANNPEGLRTRDIAVYFDEPELMQRRLAFINSVLCPHIASGRVSRTRDRSDYHNTPCDRWHITEQGIAYLERKSGPTVKQARHERAVARRVAYMLRYERAVRERPSISIYDRDKTIREWRSHGLKLHDIGNLFGISRERVRQICSEAPNSSSMV